MCDLYVRYRRRYITIRVIKITKRPVRTSPITSPRVDGDSDEDDGAAVGSATTLLSVVVVVIGLVVVWLELWSVVVREAMDNRVTPHATEKSTTKKKHKSLLSRFW